MMNLYKIIFKHFSPKDSEFGIKTYLYAKDVNDVVDYLFWEPYDDDYYFHGETTKEDVIKNQGCINGDWVSYDDCYYGLTLKGWELVEENCEVNDYLITTEIAKIYENVK